VDLCTEALFVAAVWLLDKEVKLELQMAEMCTMFVLVDVCTTVVLADVCMTFVVGDMCTPDVVADACTAVVVADACVPDVQVEVANVYVPVVQVAVSSLDTVQDSVSTLCCVAGVTSGVVKLARKETPVCVETVIGCPHPRVTIETWAGELVWPVCSARTVYYCRDGLAKVKMKEENIIRLMISTW